MQVRRSSAHDQDVHELGKEAVFAICSAESAIDMGS
jgi:hypothetical protein